MVPKMCGSFGKSIGCEPGPPWWLAPEVPEQKRQEIGILHKLPVATPPVPAFDPVQCSDDGSVRIDI